jgi:hypothetical protein
MKRPPSNAAVQGDEVCRKTAVVPSYGKLVFTATEQRCTLTRIPLLGADGGKQMR